MIPSRPPKRLVGYLSLLLLAAAARLTGQTAEPGATLLKNGDFTQVADGRALSWTAGGWKVDNSVFKCESTDGIGSPGCVSIENKAENDAWFRQTVRVVPRQLYELSGYIKGEGISGKGALGACLGLHSKWLHTEAEGSKGDFDWKRVSMTFVADSTSADIVCRLGWFGQLVTGKAYFDHICLTNAPGYAVRFGTNVSLYLEAADTASIPNLALTEWLRRLDQAYLDYTDLVGATPFHGTNIGILSVRSYPGGWAVAGNPIRWHQRYVADELGRVAKNDEWSFGILHELGHDFDLEGRWVWNGEFWANLKMYYVVSKRNAAVSPGYSHVYYRGAGLKEYYQNQRGGATQLTWDYMTYRFITVFETVGWDAVKAAFRTLNALPPAKVPRTKQEKLDLYLETLSKASGQNVVSYFPRFELEWMRKENAR